jgi:ankyrin repeat protein
MRCMVEELRADVNKPDEKVVGCTPLFLAVCAGRVDMVRSLADLGADLNQVTEDGLMLLHWSALEGRLDMVRCLLLELGAVVNKGGQRGSTPLYCAAQNGHLEVVRFLVEYGADVDQANDNGQTPLMAASFKKNEKVFRCLIKHGANVQASTASGHRASDVSKMGGAPMAQTEYLEAKAHCSSPGCSGAGLKKCTGCKQVRYCGQACQLAHWKAHKSDCQTNKELRRKPRDE